LAIKTLTYDNNGNLLTITDSGGTTTYTRNAMNQLTGISGPGVSASFVYDGLGRREKKTINGSLTEFLFDGVNPVQETSGTAIVANILPGLGVDEFLTRTDVSGGATSSFLSDALGSSVALTDTAGTVQTEYTYEAFGRTTATGASNSSSHKYTGRENDGTGLYYYRARYYNPVLQRFISEDPIEFEGGWNFYTYVDNSPLNFIDPFGEAQRGPRKLNVNLPDGRQMTKSTPLNQIQEAVDLAKKLGWSEKTIANLKALEKVVKRGGTIAILLELAFPDDANAGEDDLLCQAAPTTCRPSKSSE
jgi:RHS repeat-associated protein